MWSKCRRLALRGEMIPIECQVWLLCFYSWTFLLFSLSHDINQLHVWGSVMDGAVGERTWKGAVLGQVCHRTEEAFSSTHGLLWRPHKTKKKTANRHKHATFVSTETERGKKMISSLNWDLLLGGSELTAPFLPPFFLALLCYPLQLWDDSFFPQMLWVMWPMTCCPFT